MSTLATFAPPVLARGTRVISHGVPATVIVSNAADEWAGVGECVSIEFDKPRRGFHGRDIITAYADCLGVL